MPLDLVERVRQHFPGEDGWTEHMQEYWWGLTRQQFPYAAFTWGKLPDPKMVTGLDGAFVTCTAGDNRLWAFEQEASRDRFCEGYGGEHITEPR